MYHRLRQKANIHSRGRGIGREELQVGAQPGLRFGEGAEADLGSGATTSAAGVQAGARAADFGCGCGEFSQRGAVQNLGPRLGAQVAQQRGGVVAGTHVSIGADGVIGVIAPSGAKAKADVAVEAGLDGVRVSASWVSASAPSSVSSNMFTP